LAISLKKPERKKISKNPTLKNIGGRTLTTRAVKEKFFYQAGEGIDADERV